MSTPVVVQGTAVSDPYGSDPYGSAIASSQQQQFDQYASGQQQQIVYNDQPQHYLETTAGNPGGTTATNNDDFSGKGEKQETKCRDPAFALLLYINVGAIAAVCGIYGKDALNYDSDTSSTTNYNWEPYLWTVLVSGAASVVLSGVMLAILMRIPQFLIKTALLFSVIATLAWAVIAFGLGQIGLAIIGIIFFAISVCYAYVVWSRIPFATQNLITAMKSITHNCGVTIVAYVFAFLGFGWSLLWTIAMLGLWDKAYKCETDGVTGNEVCSDPNYGLLFAMFISYFFTHQVLQYSVHVTVAGVVGTWWFSPEEGKGCCSSGIINSFIRTMTTSFGSICFGSIIVAIIQALKQLAYTARANDDGGILACIAECILACLASIIEYFNKWAFVYVGLYGYGYLKAGKNVFTLFKNRGWDAIITDDLISNVLFLMSLITGGLTGCIGLLVETTAGFFDDSTELAGNENIVAFILAFLVGLVLSSILMSTIGSAVNAVIVLFADAPADFERNYPDLSQKMRDTWRSAFPGSI